MKMECDVFLLLQHTHWPSSPNQRPLLPPSSLVCVDGVMAPKRNLSYYCVYEKDKLMEENEKFCSCSFSLVLYSFVFTFPNKTAGQDVELQTSLLEMFFIVCDLKKTKSNDHMAI